MLDQIEKKNFIAGIYTSADDWKKIAGNSEKFNQLRLWYKSDDGVQSFDDFRPFGGWTKPSWKRFATNEKVCDVEAYESWMDWNS